MARKQDTTEDTIQLLGEAEVALAQGPPMVAGRKRLSITANTHHRRRRVVSGWSLPIGAAHASPNGN